MEKPCPSLAVFQQMTEPEQLEILVYCGVVLPYLESEDLTYYKVEDYFVCVTTSLMPWAVKRVEAFAALPILH